jgi:hypothetical protein
MFTLAQPSVGCVPQYVPLEQPLAKGAGTSPGGCCSRTKWRSSLSLTPLHTVDNGRRGGKLDVDNDTNQVLVASHSKAPWSKLWPRGLAPPMGGCPSPTDSRLNLLVHLIVPVLEYGTRGPQQGFTKKEKKEKEVKKKGKKKKKKSKKKKENEKEKERIRKEERERKRKKRKRKKEKRIRITRRDRPDQTRPDQTRPDQTRPDNLILTRPDLRILRILTRPDQTRLILTRPDRPDQTRPDQTRPDQTI